MDKRFTIVFRTNNDEDIIEKLDQVNNKSEYIKNLIRKDTGLDCDKHISHRGKNAIDLTGKRFGKWMVIKRDYEGTKPGCTKWICRCDCGKECSVNGQALRSGSSTQCIDCWRESLHASKADPRRRINGKPTATYVTWDAIIHRCYYKSQKSYKYYGARGITMCDEWKNDYFAFYEYVSQLERFGLPGMTLDRIDNDKGYEPGNVRWVTRLEQNRHRRDRE